MFPAVVPPLPAAWPRQHSKRRPWRGAAAKHVKPGYQACTVLCQAGPPPRRRCGDRTADLA